MIPLSRVVGQDRAIAVLKESLAAQRLHHALLFSGPKGVGKHTTALALAAALFCEAGQDDACGVCAACVQVAAGTHPDLRCEGLRRSESKGDEKSRVSIEQVRNLQVFLGGRALAGRWKVAAVDEAQALSAEAQNAFLKVLEEPPGDSLIILVAHNASALFPTVRSRCQRVTFAPLPPTEIERILRERHGRSPEDARLLAATSDGSLGAALSRDAASLRQELDRLSRALERVASGRYEEISAAAQEFAGEPGERSFRLSLLLGILRRRLRAAAGLEATDPPASPSLPAALDGVESAYAALVSLRRNANAPLAIEAMWLEIAEGLTAR